MTMRQLLLLLLPTLACAATAAPVLAQPLAPVAIVEDVDPAVKGVALLDYVESGKRIDLGRGSIVLDYLASCTRETVTGGSLVVGDSQSTVTGGQVKRDTVTCDGGKLALADPQASKSGAMVFRAPPSQNKGRATLPKPAITIYGCSPIVTLANPVDVLQIERLDVDGPVLTLKPLKGRVDLAKEGQQLEAGGLYKVKAGARELVFLIDSSAKPGPGPAVARLLRL